MLFVLHIDSLVSDDKPHPLDNLYQAIIQKGFHAHYHVGDLSSIQLSKPAILLSTSHSVLAQDDLQKFTRAIGLLPSLLPWNRGFHSNFWSHYDGTPLGATLYEIEPGLHQGAILVEKALKISPSSTFFQVAKQLKTLLFSMVMDELENFIQKKNSSHFHPIGLGSFHEKRDLPTLDGIDEEELLNEIPAWGPYWHYPIDEIIPRLQKKQQEQIKEGLSIIDEIEKVRTKNNINWMNLLRQSFQSSPGPTLNILSAINDSDEAINLLLKRLAHLNSPSIGTDKP